MSMKTLRDAAAPIHVYVYDQALICTTGDLWVQFMSVT